MVFNLLARTFEIILYKTLHNKIGKKSLTKAKLSHFGINTIIVSFKAIRN